MFSWNVSIKRLNYCSCNSIFFSISSLISISFLLRVNICWSIGIFFLGFLFLRLERISFSFSRDDVFSLRSTSSVLSHSKLLSISPSSLDSSDLSLLQVACGVDDRDWNVIFSVVHSKLWDWAWVESTAPSKLLLILSMAGDPDHVWLHKSKNVATTRPLPLCLPESRTFL